MVLDSPSSSDQSPLTSVVNTPTKRTAPSPPTSPSRLRCERSLYIAPSGSPICGTRGVPNSYFFDLKGFLHWNDGSRFASQSCSAGTSAKESSKETCSISSLVDNPERKDRLQIATIATICPSKSLPAVIHSWGGVCFQESHYSQRQSAEFVFGFRGIPPLTASSVGVRHSTNSWKYIPIHVILWNRKKTSDDLTKLGSEGRRRNELGICNLLWKRKAFTCTMQKLWNHESVLFPHRWRIPEHKLLSHLQIPGGILDGLLKEKEPSIFYEKLLCITLQNKIKYEHQCHLTS